ncbi:O-methyltransferase [Novosphingobium sp. TH158]|uniref:O-methyltransferase n=1 Tax=Novosphingobium sp. TH158 TaxID=2067455 RepID=UPI000C7D67F6|nr:class I SAM-dependent methyltransferase [Novosphingobium sp. TH158]PLK25479.1 hypothetical protein C0V78_00180 [Novosphingobium sp. TH158]
MKEPGALLAELFAGKATYADGRSVGDTHSVISPAFAQALGGFVAREKPKLVVEVGMALGASSLAILSALDADARLISIDPFQSTDYKGVGKSLVEQSNRASQHVLIEKPDYVALPELLAQNIQPDLVYIDGMHTFDYVALDAFYADKLVRPGGVVAFNDCGFRSIHKFLKYFQKHRHYEEIDVGLRPDYRGANPLVTLVRTITRRSNQDRYFRKVDSWEPEHNYFRNF